MFIYFCLCLQNKKLEIIRLHMTYWWNVQITFCASNNTTIDFHITEMQLCLCNYYLLYISSCNRISLFLIPPVQMWQRELFSVVTQPDNNYYITSNELYQFMSEITGFSSRDLEIEVKHLNFYRSFKDYELWLTCWNAQTYTFAKHVRSEEKEMQSSCINDFLVNSV